MEVRYGTLFDVYGRPARHGGYTFMPAHVGLEGRLFGGYFRLCDHLGPRVPPVLGRPVEEGFDAAWVRARIPGLFGFTPDMAEVEKALIDVGFVAVTADVAACYPFICTDHYGISTLKFSDAGPDEDVKRSIAEAFWGALLQDPDDLADFEQRVDHPGVEAYGCEAGWVYCDEHG